jgi:hypothetical protein
MDPDQTALMRRLVWIHAGHKNNMLVLCDAAHIFSITQIFLKISFYMNINNSKIREYEIIFDTDLQIIVS